MAPKQWTDNLHSIAESQNKVAEAAKTLVGRLETTSAYRSGRDDQGLTENVNKAVEKMGPISENLMKNNATAALPLEGEAYNYLGKAAALYTEIQVSQGRGGGGGGGGGSRAPRILPTFSNSNWIRTRTSTKPSSAVKASNSPSRNRKLRTSSKNLPSASRPRLQRQQREQQNPQNNQRNIQQLRRDLEEMAAPARTDGEPAEQSAGRSGCASTSAGCPEHEERRAERQSPAATASSAAGIECGAAG